MPARGTNSSPGRKWCSSLDERSGSLKKGGKERYAQAHDLQNGNVTTGACQGRWLIAAGDLLADFNASLFGISLERTLDRAWARGGDHASLDHESVMLTEGSASSVTASSIKFVQAASNEAGLAMLIQHAYLPSIHPSYTSAASSVRFPPLNLTSPSVYACLIVTPSSTIENFWLCYTRLLATDRTALDLKLPLYHLGIPVSTG
ncbi:hypothetical protein NMY22_g18424 [Coprinellus aureogranulatus]|nr:hypothetical protein NMY22_g18424 [Coprinellus aureogranulatus]